MYIKPLEPEPMQVPDDIRPLTPEEIQTVAHIFAEKGCDLPSPNTSSFVGAIRGGRVVAFLVVQLKIHAEPMWIEPGQSAVFPALVQAAEAHILRTVGAQWVYLFSPAGRVAQMAQSVGMQVEPWVVMSKLVAPPLPTRTDGFTLMPDADEAIQ